MIRLTRPWGLPRARTGGAITMLNTLGIDPDYIGKYKISAGLFVALFAAAWGTLAYRALANSPHTAHTMESHAIHQTSHGELATLILMIAAMMLPMIAGHLLHIARSLNARHRLPAMVLFFACYSGGWVILLSGITWLAGTVTEAADLSSAALSWTAIALFFAAGYWGQHPANKAFRSRCGRLGVVHVSGFRVYRSIMTYARKTWLQCALECGLVMIAMVLMIGHSLLLMVLMTAILLVDRYLVVIRFKSISNGWIAIGAWLLLSELTALPHPF
ncbi:DUF2182 domain-containing protein [Photobacterium sp. TY1-4]|uniref:DUF2182 domain-containing protein n=1 Tax=Photobacterium sp. TY1-4 TaxID=2899122 RepID=UPI0021BE8BF7|nr:DUF2182 domain-containing protein [Photobacterium sp. TY1-4]UXI04692.1 DUF2182 domain-containing protein [Photobacterium sp. TY1-4]